MCMCMRAGAAFSPHGAAASAAHRTAQLGDQLLHRPAAAAASAAAAAKRKLLQQEGMLDGRITGAHGVCHASLS